MLSERERQDLVEMAASVELRKEFSKLRESALLAGRSLDVDEFIRWLTGVSRAVGPVEHPLPVDYGSLLL